MVMRAIGAYNGNLPEATGIVIAAMRDPKEMAYLNYAQLVPLLSPDTPHFRWCKLDVPEFSRLVDLKAFGWDYGDYRPTGKDFKIRADWQADRVQRWDFPYTMDSVTESAWNNTGINVRSLLDMTRLNHAHLHRACRVVDALTSATYPAASTGTPQSLLGLASPAYLNESSGKALTPAGLPNPNFQILKKVLQAIQKRIHLTTNGAVKPRNMNVVISPGDAQMLSQTDEIFEARKQWSSVANLSVSEMDQEFVERWALPPTYGGFRFVVEDTPRVIIRQKEGDTGTVADVDIPDDLDYLMADGDAMYFTLRSEGMDGAPGTKTFSTLQIYHRNGEARVEGFSEPKHDLFEGHVVMEDKVVIPSLLGSYKLTGYLAG